MQDAVATSGDHGNEAGPCVANLSSSNDVVGSSGVGGAATGSS